MVPEGAPGSEGVRERKGVFVMCSDFLSDDEHSVTTESALLEDFFHKNIPDW